MTTIFSEIQSYLREGSPTLMSLTLTLSILLIVIMIFKTKWKSKSKKEGFDEQQPYTWKDLTTTDNNVYDDFYVSIYDYLMHCPERYSFELMSLYRETHPSNRSVMLDIGCGTGHEVHMLAQTFQCSVVGIDKSKAMIDQCRKNYPDLSSSFMEGDVQHRQQFQSYTFTHIVCFNFTVYEMENKSLFFQNVIKWLRNGGYLVLHLVNENEIQSILPSSLINDADKNYKYKTKIDFNDFQYQSTFITPTVFQEGFTFFATGRKRKQEHHLYMESQEHILTLARNEGFIVQQKINMNVCNYANHFLYILQKP